MKNRMFKLHFKKAKQLPYNALPNLDLPLLIDKIKHDEENKDINTMILLKSPKKQIVLTAMHEGTEIKSYQVNDSITFQIIEGKLMFHTRKKTVSLDKGKSLTLRDKTKYNLTSNEETVLLLTINSIRPST